MEGIVRSPSTLGRVSQFFWISPPGSNTPSGQGLFFGGNKTPSYSVQKEDYFYHPWQLLERLLQNLPSRCPLGSQLSARVDLKERWSSSSGKKRPLLGGGPVGKIGINICIKDIEASNIDKHSAKRKVDGTFGTDPKLPLVTGYYLQTVGTVASVYSEPFLPAALAKSSQVFRDQLEKNPE